MRRNFVVVILGLVGWLFVTAAPAGALANAPAYPKDFPDPSVLVSQGTYWAYSTGSGGRNLQVMSSSDLAHWPATPSDPLPVLPAWASVGLTWAPSVVELDGRYLMYYTVRQTASARQCVSVASASSPAGPFTDASTGPLVCQLERFGSIDPSVFSSGTARYLLWKSEDNAQGGRTHLWAARLSSDGTALVGPTRRLLDQGAGWQAPSMEGPEMVADGSAYYLFYGAGDWSSAAAGIGYAVCSSPLGPCVDRSVTGPWLAARPGASGPSGPAVFRDLSGVTRLAYHAWPGAVGYENGGVRALFVNRLSFSAGRPTLS
jgi:beta-xylosidase